MTEPMIPDPVEVRLVHRLVFFTDAVFAIVLTILVLELHPPMTAAEATLGRFVETWPHLFAYALSFGIVAVYWVAHLNVTGDGCISTGRRRWPTWSSSASSASRPTPRPGWGRTSPGLRPGRSTA